MFRLFSRGVKTEEESIDYTPGPAPGSSELASGVGGRQTPETDVVSAPQPIQQALLQRLARLRVHLQAHFVCVCECVYWAHRMMHEFLVRACTHGAQ